MKAINFPEWIAHRLGMNHAPAALDELLSVLVRASLLRHAVVGSGSVYGVGAVARILGP